METATVQRKGSRISLLNETIEEIRRLPQTGNDRKVAINLARIAALTDNLASADLKKSAALHKMASLCFDAAGDPNSARKEHAYMLSLLYDDALNGNQFEVFRDRRLGIDVAREDAAERESVNRAIDLAMIAFISLNLKRPDEIDRPQSTILLMPSRLEPESVRRLERSLTGWLRGKTGRS